MAASHSLRIVMATLHADGVHVVLIEKLDRLARDLQEGVIADLGKHGFELVSRAVVRLHGNRKACGLHSGPSGPRAAARG